MNARRPSDVWLIAQSLHYVDPVARVRTLKRCVRYEHRRHKGCRSIRKPLSTSRPAIAKVIRPCWRVGTRNANFRFDHIAVEVLAMTYQEKAKTIPCPVCEAAIGSFCDMPTREGVHVARYHVAIGVDSAEEVRGRLVRHGSAGA